MADNRAELEKLRDMLDSVNKAADALGDRIIKDNPLNMGEEGLSQWLGSVAYLEHQLALTISQHATISMKNIDGHLERRAKVAEGVEQKWSIWSEGYRATGEHGTATRHAVVQAKTFKEACDNLAQKDASFRSYYDPDRMTYWGCRLYDNEADARRSFG